MPIFILVGEVVLLVCIKSALIMSLPAQTINETPLNSLSGQRTKVPARQERVSCLGKAQLLQQIRHHPHRHRHQDL